MGLTAGKIPKASSADHIEDGYDVNTAVGTPGVDTALTTEKAIRDALNLKANSTHASNHTNGTDDIQDATSSQKGLATATQITKLNGIEAGADVTDAANVAAAGALMVTTADAKGDLLVASGDNAISRLAIGTNRYRLIADSTQTLGVKWVQEIKEQWFSCGADDQAPSTYAADNISNGSSGYITFSVPYDYNNLVSAKIIFMAGNTNATADIDINLNYASVGEIRTTHFASDTTSTYNITQNYIHEINITSLLGNLSAGDICGIQFLNNTGATQRLLGLRLVYGV